MNICIKIILIIILIIISCVIIFTFFNKSQTNQKGSGYRIGNDLFDDYYVTNPDDTMKKIMNKFDKHHNDYLVYLCDYISNTPSEIDQKSKYIVVGDVHGSILQLFMPLKQAKILKSISYNPNTSKFEYTFESDLKNSILTIYCGDLVGRAPHSLTIPMMITFCKIFKEINRKYLEILHPELLATTSTIDYLWSFISAKTLSLDDFAKLTRKNEYYKECKIVWTYGNHDVGFIKHHLFGKNRTFNDVYKSEYIDITSDVKLLQDMIDLLNENIVINPYVCIYYNPDLHIQVSHTLIPAKYQKINDKNSKRFFVTYGIDAIYQLFSPTMDDFIDLYYANITHNENEIDLVSERIEEKYKAGYPEDAEMNKLEILEALFIEDNIVKHPVINEDDYLFAIQAYKDKIIRTEQKIDYIKQSKKQPKIVNNKNKNIDYYTKIIDYCSDKIAEYEDILDNNFDIDNCDKDIYKIVENIEKNVRLARNVPIDPLPGFNNLNDIEQIKFINNFAKYVAISSSVGLSKPIFDHILYWYRPDLRSNELKPAYLINKYYQIPNTKYFVGHTIMNIINNDMVYAKNNNELENIYNEFEKYGSINFTTNNYHKKYLNKYNILNNNEIYDNYNIITYKINIIMSEFINRINNDGKYNNFLNLVLNYYKSNSKGKLLQNKINNNLFFMDIGATFALNTIINKLLQRYDLKSIVNNIISNQSNLDIIDKILTPEIGYYMCAFAIGLDNNTVISSKVYFF